MKKVVVTYEWTGNKITGGVVFVTRDVNYSPLAGGPGRVTFECSRFPLIPFYIKEPFDFCEQRMQSR